MDEIKSFRPTFIKLGTDKDTSNNKKTEYINSQNILSVQKNEGLSSSSWKVFFKEMQEDGSYAINEASISDDVAKQLNIIA